MATFTITYADGSTDTQAHAGSAEQLFEQLFSACSEEIREKCSVVKVKKAEVESAKKPEASPVKK